MGFELRALVVGSGFEPLKAKPADLQSAPIGHSGNPPGFMHLLQKLGATLALYRPCLPINSFYCAPR